MNDSNKHLEALHDIRKLMRESSKFVSLSGLSGILAGFIALAGSVFGYMLFEDYVNNRPLLGLLSPTTEHLEWLTFAICVVVLLLSGVMALIFSGKKARKHGVKLFDHTSWKVLFAIGVPLICGALFCIACWHYGGMFYYLIAPSMLIFYGLGLISADKYTIHHTRWLGYAELVVGFMALFNLGNGLMFWAIGFGILHVLYGAIMYYGFDRK